MSRVQPLHGVYPPASPFAPDLRWECPSFPLDCLFFLCFPLMSVSLINPLIPPFPLFFIVLSPSAPLDYTSLATRVPGCNQRAFVVSSHLLLLPLVILHPFLVVSVHALPPLSFLLRTPKLRIISLIILILWNLHLFVILHVCAPCLVTDFISYNLKVDDLS